MADKNTPPVPDTSKGSTVEETVEKSIPTPQGPTIEQSHEPEPLAESDVRDTLPSPDKDTD